jgi:thiol:disulfide interchange protein DsbD
MQSGGKQLAFPFSLLMAKNFLIALVIGGLVSLPAAANPVQRDHIEAELIPASTGIEPASVLTVALRLKPDEHWHTYWKNPGDSGLATHIAWELPDGFEAGAIQWPTPTRIDVGPLANYGYDGEVLLLTDIRVPSSLPASVPIRASASWLVCEEICIPGDADFALTLPAGPAKPHPLWSDRIEQARASLPTAVEGLQVTAQLVGGKDWILSLPRSAMLNTGKLAFFPDEEGWIEYAAPQQTYEDDGKVHLRVAAAPDAGNREGPLTGLLVADTAFAVGRNAALISPGVTAVEGMPVPPLTPAGNGLSLLIALAFACVGGLILNLMPCVFPVVGIKVLTFMENSRSSPASLRGHGLLFGFGVVACFWLIAGVLLALRAAGASLGWGFQLQSPIVVSGLALLFFLLALNMSGVFELGTRAQQLAGSLRANSSYLDAFLSGVIATIVATPCTAPFMGAALGFAVTQSAVVAMSVFTALAVGMAAPYVLLSFMPKLVARLPKPGTWMVTLREILAFPLYFTTVWLAWVLGKQLGIDAVAMLMVGMIFFGAGVWVYGRWNMSPSPRLRVAVRVLAVSFVAVGGVIAWPQGSPQALPASSSDTASGEWMPWSKQAVSSALDAGHPVFVDFTAAWCVTCQFNKQMVLEKDSVRERFESANVTTLIADWTNHDPEISAEIDGLGRSGIPVYVFYQADGGEPLLLPELLTESIVLEAIDKVDVSTRVAAKED